MLDAESDRRDYFRVDDKVFIEYEVVSDHQMSVGVQELARGSSGELGLSAALLRMEGELTAVLSTMEPKAPEAARAIGLINNKINALVSLLPVLQNPENNLLTKPVRRCNLSASGIAFPNNEELPTGTKLLLRMVLPPSYYYVVAYAEVIRCTPARKLKEGGKYNVAVRFTFLLDRYREILIRHSFMREKQVLKERRIAKDRLPDLEDGRFS